MTYLDANFVLRLLLDDVPLQAREAAGRITDSLAGSLCLDRVTLAEVTYVLRGKGYNHEQIVFMITSLYAYTSLAAAEEIEQAALEIFKATKLDFEDCLLAARHQIDGATVATFDKALLTYMAKQ